MKRTGPTLLALTGFMLILALWVQNVNGITPPGQAVTEPRFPAGPDAPAGITPTPTLAPTAVPTATATPSSPPPSSSPQNDPNTSCLRINFEVSGHFAREGLYEVREAHGRFLTSWYAYDGWQDSGWIDQLLISFDAVHVEVLYYPPESDSVVTMAMYNPAPDTPYGWVARGMCHALEVGWP